MTWTGNTTQKVCHRFRSWSGTKELASQILSGHKSNSMHTSHFLINTLFQYLKACSNLSLEDRSVKTSHFYLEYLSPGNGRDSGFKDVRGTLPMV
jgi:hypothetical protein